MTEINIKDIEMLNNTDQDIIRQKEIIYGNRYVFSDSLMDQKFNSLSDFPGPF